MSSPLATPGLPARVGIYVRISEDREKREYGVENQLEQCEALAADKHLTVVGDPYRDNDVSAYDRKLRPAFERLKADLRSGVLDGVIAWHPDRLYRRTVDLLDLIELADVRPFVIYLCRGTSLDLRNPLERMTAKLISSVTEYESEQKADRQALANRARAKKGEWHGGPVPLGYRLAEPPAKGIVKDERAAEVLEAAAGMLLAKQSLSEVTQWVREQDLRDWRGEPRWKNLKPISLKANLLSPTIVGKRAYIPQAARVEHSEKRKNGLAAGNLPAVGMSLSDAAWDPILDLETWQRLSALLLDPDRSSHKGRRPTKSFLAGRVFCWECRAPMGYSTGAYKCHKQAKRPDGTPGCGRVSISTPGLEGHINWFTRYTMPLRAETAPEVEEVEDTSPAIDALLAQKAELRRLMTDGGYSDLAEYRADMNALEEKRKALVTGGAQARREQLAHKSQRMTVEQWDEATVAQRRAYLESWPAYIFIKKSARGKKSGPHYDEDRVLLFWNTHPDRLSEFKNLVPDDYVIPPEALSPSARQPRPARTTRRKYA